MLINKSKSNPVTKSTITVKYNKYNIKCYKVKHEITIKTKQKIKCRNSRNKYKNQSDTGNEPLIVSNSLSFFSFYPNFHQNVACKYILRFKTVRDYVIQRNQTNYETHSNASTRSIKNLIRINLKMNRHGGQYNTIISGDATRKAYGVARRISCRRLTVLSDPVSLSFSANRPSFSLPLSYPTPPSQALHDGNRYDRNEQAEFFL